MQEKRIIKKSLTRYFKDSIKFFDNAPCNWKFIGLAKGLKKFMELKNISLEDLETTEDNLSHFKRFLEISYINDLLSDGYKAIKEKDEVEFNRIANTINVKIGYMQKKPTDPKYDAINNSLLIKIQRFKKIKLASELLMVYINSTNGQKQYILKQMLGILYKNHAISEDIGATDKEAALINKYLEEIKKAEKIKNGI